MFQKFFVSLSLLTLFLYLLRNFVLIHFYMKLFACILAVMAVVYTNSAPTEDEPTGEEGGDQFLFYCRWLSKFPLNLSHFFLNRNNIFLRTVENNLVS
jgi:hypothetical protein